MGTDESVNRCVIQTSKYRTPIRRLRKLLYATLLLTSAVSLKPKPSIEALKWGSGAAFRSRNACASARVGAPRPHEATRNKSCGSRVSSATALPGHFSQFDDYHYQDTKGI
jgi:hypothetical protein